MSAVGADIGHAKPGAGIANVTGVGSQLNLESELKVGGGGPGTLNIMSGGVVAR